MSFTPLQHLLIKTASRYGFVKEFKAIQVCAAFNDTITDTFGDLPTAERDIKAAKYTGGILTIQVPSSAWANEIMIRKEKIIKTVNEKLPTRKGTPTVKAVHTKVQTTSWNVAPNL